MRDVTLEDTFIHAFTTRAFADAVPDTLAGTPVLSVLEGGNATPITAGVSVAVDRASVVGLNEATIVATSANGYELGKSYAIYISTGNVDGTSVVGEVVGLFTIAASAAAVDLANGSDGLGEIKAVVDAIPTTAMRGTDNAALASVATETRLAELDPANLPTDIAAIPLTAMRGTDNAALASVATETRLAELDPANLPTDIAAIPLTAMRGTDNAALASVATELRLAELDPANLPTDIAAIPLTAMRGTDGANTTTPPTVGEVADAVLDELLSGHVIAGSLGKSVADTEADAAASLANTDDMQPKLGAPAGADMSADILVIDGLIDDLIATIGVAGVGLGDLGGMSTAMKAEVNAEVVDVTNVDTHAEPGQEAPGPTISRGKKLDFLYKWARNLSEQSATERVHYADDGLTVDQKVPVSDNGTIYSDGEVVSGP